MSVKNSHVLVVEDSQIAQISAVSLLEQLDCQVSAADSGEQAIEKSKGQAFDLIFMDIGLPDIDVLTVTETILNHYQHLGQDKPIIIAVTAYGSDSIKAQCLKAGMSDFIEKPLTSSAAKQLLERYTVEA